MIIRIWNDDSTDHCDYEGTLEEIHEQCQKRIKTPTWKNGWSETIKKDKEND